MKVEFYDELTTMKDEKVEFASETDKIKEVFMIYLCIYYCVGGSKSKRSLAIFFIKEQGSSS